MGGKQCRIGGEVGWRVGSGEGRGKGDTFLSISFPLFFCSHYKDRPPSPPLSAPSLLVLDLRCRAGGTGSRKRKSMSSSRSFSLSSRKPAAGALAGRPRRSC